MDKYTKFMPKGCTEEITKLILGATLNYYEYPSEQKDYIKYNLDNITNIDELANDIIKNSMHLCDEWIKKNKADMYFKEMKEMTDRIYESANLNHEISHFIDVIVENMDTGEKEVQIDVIPCISSSNIRSIYIALCIDCDYAVEPKEIYVCNESENFIEAAYIIYRHIVEEQAYPVSLEEISFM